MDEVTQFFGVWLLLFCITKISISLSCKLDCESELLQAQARKLEAEAEKLNQE